ncbi:MAG: YggT family protein [Thiolinea sp.]
MPLRRFIPPVGKVDSASLVLAYLLKFVAGLLIMLMISGDMGINLGYLLMAALVDLVRTLIWIYIIALIVHAVMSWMGNTYGNPVASLLDSLTRPVLQPVRNIVPTIGMVDLSPLVAIILLQVCLIVLEPLPKVF